MTKKLAQKFRIWFLVTNDTLYLDNGLPTVHYGNTGCGVFKRGVQNQKDFCIRKIGHHSNKKKLKLILSKNINNKKCAPELVFFNEKKIEKDSDDF